MVGTESLDRHAVATAEIATIRHRDPQITQAAPHRIEWFCHCPNMAGIPTMETLINQKIPQAYELELKAFPFIFVTWTLSIPSQKPTP